MKKLIKTIRTLAKRKTIKTTIKKKQKKNWAYFFIESKLESEIEANKS